MRVKMTHARGDDRDIDTYMYTCIYIYIKRRGGVLEKRVEATFAPVYYP